jgi:hypothetical protein
MKKRISCSSFLNDQIGLSFIEVLVAISIFSIGFLAIGILVMTTTQNTTHGNMLTQATMLAREKIEFLKTLPLDRLADACLDENEPETINKTYRRECEVGPLGISTTIKTIEVSVIWRRFNIIRRVVLETNTRRS